MRFLAGLLAFREAAPFEGSEAFVPRDEAKRASKELGRLRRRNPGHVSCVMESPWHVPVRWFVLFDDEAPDPRARRPPPAVVPDDRTEGRPRRIERAIPLPAFRTWARSPS